MRTSTSALPALLALLAALAITFARTAPADDQVSVRFVAIPMPSAPETLELLVEGGRTMPVEIPSNRLSQAYPVPEMEHWVLGETLETAGAQPRFKASGKAPAISSYSQLIIVIPRSADHEEDEHDGNDEHDLDLLVMDDSMKNFGGGGYLLINASDLEISGSIGTGEFTLKPREHQLLAPEPTSSNDGRHYALAQFLHHDGEDAPRPFFSGTWRFNENVRSVVFFHQEPDSDRIRVSTIRDQLP